MLETQDLNEQPTTRLDNKTITRRLYQYALRAKKTFVVALIMLVIGVGAELAGPFIAKNIIDNHMFAINQPFYQTTADDPHAAEYNGAYYKRQGFWGDGETKGLEVHVVQSGTSFYFVEGPMDNTTGDKTFDDGTLTIRTAQGEQAVYPAVALSSTELFSFYQPELPGIYQLVGLYFIFLLITIVTEFGKTYWMQSSANKVIQELRIDLYAHIQRLPVPFFDNLPAGKVVSRVTNDTEAVKDLFVAVLSNFSSGAVYMLGVYIALFILDFRLGMVCLFLVPLLILWIILYRNIATKYNRIIRSRLSEINAIINESIQGMSIIRIFRKQKQTEDEFEKLNNDYQFFQNKMLRLNSLTSFNLVNVLRNLTFALVLWYFGSASLGSFDSAISLGVLYAFVDVLGRLFQPMTGMVNQLAALDLSMVSAGRVFELLDEEGEHVTDGAMPRYKGNVRFQDVTFAYKKDPVLKHIDFEAKQGQTVALVGHTGSGKSSIINLLFRFYDPQQGTITIDGQNIRELPKQWIRQHMGIVLQDPYLFTGTIASNVSLDNEQISRERLEQALRDVGAEQILSDLPKGFDEPVVEKGSTLSAGQRQLISFARALAYDPAILILDEATANIDTETEALIQSALEVLKRGRTTFIVAHRLSTIRSADQILVLHRGEIVERGSHEELMEIDGRYRQMYRVQTGIGSNAILDGTEQPQDREAPVPTGLRTT
ncbi:ABC transporter ATP-binding protein [Paenibacillus sp. WLX2291]|uniref:ABC transporter ATP-binding protein n=1 Tax=Paenibacillus sp. WLX2291 TaxID=3296934 RepID=UPI0039845446